MRLCIFKCVYFVSAGFFGDCLTMHVGPTPAVGESKYVPFSLVEETVSRDFISLFYYVVEHFKVFKVFLVIVYIYNTVF